MQAVKQRLKDILAQAKGTRWDRVAARACGILSITAGLAPYAHLLPGRTGATIAGVCGFCGMFLPRAQKAAGLLSVAYGQKTPLLKVLPDLARTLLTAPKIAADAKAQADAQASADKAAEKAALIREAVAEVEARFKTGAYSAGTGPDNLSQSIPSNLSQAAPEKLAAEEKAGSALLS